MVQGRVGHVLSNLTNEEVPRTGARESWLQVGLVSNQQAKRNVFFYSKSRFLSGLKFLQALSKL